MCKQNKIKTCGIVIVTLRYTYDIHKYYTLKVHIQVIKVMLVIILFKIFF